jgi:trk system potassium uptake protein
MKIFMNKRNCKNVIIAGCGLACSQLAIMLAAQKKNITMIDPSDISDPSDYFHIKGDATDIDVLEYAGIKSADIVIAATDDDNSNIMIAKIAKELYQVGQVIARVEDRSKESAYKHLDISILCPTTLMYNEIRQIFEETGD